MHDPASIAARLRTTGTAEQGSAWLTDLDLDRNELLAVAAELGLSRLEGLSKPKIHSRVIQQAITARRKYDGLRDW